MMQEVDDAGSGIVEELGSSAGIGPLHQVCCGILHCVNWPMRGQCDESLTNPVFHLPSVPANPAKTHSTLPMFSQHYWNVTIVRPCKPSS